MPQKRVRSAAGSASASSVIDRPEVFDAKIACGADVRRHLLEERLLPVHALADGLDHEVAIREQLAGARRSWPATICARAVAVASGLGLELREAVDRLPRVGALVLALGRPGRTGAARTLALARCAAICAPITPAPSTAALRMMRRGACARGAGLAAALAAWSRVSSLMSCLHDCAGYRARLAPLVDRDVGESAPPSRARPRCVPGGGAARTPRRRP